MDVEHKEDSVKLIEVSSNPNEVPISIVCNRAGIFLLADDDFDRRPAFVKALTHAVDNASVELAKCGFVGVDVYVLKHDDYDDEESEHPAKRQHADRNGAARAVATTTHAACKECMEACDFVVAIGSLPADGDDEHAISKATVAMYMAIATLATVRPTSVLVSSPPSFVSATLPASMMTADDNIETLAVEVVRRLLANASCVQITPGAFKSVIVTVTGPQVPTLTLSKALDRAGLATIEGAVFVCVPLVDHGAISDFLLGKRNFKARADFVHHASGKHMREFYHWNPANGADKVPAASTSIEGVNVMVVGHSPETEDEQVLVVEERGRCKFVSGAVDLGESKRNAAVRELAEETGLPANTFRRSPEHGDVKDDAVTAEHVALTYVGGWNKKRARRDVNDNVSCFKVVVDGDCFKVNPHPKDGELQKVYWMSLPKVTLIAKHYTAFDATGKFAKTAAEAEKKKTEGADVAAIETAGKDAFKDSMTRSFADVGLVYTNPWYTEPLVWVNNLAAGKEMAVGRMGKDGDVW